MAGRKSTASMELAIGAAIIAGIVLLICMLSMWGNTSSILRRHYRVVVEMANIGDLKEGAPVKVGGLQIGSVSSMQLRASGNMIDVVLNIDEKRLLAKDSTARIANAGLVGDSFMEIVPGRSTEHLRRASNIAEADHIECQPAPDFSALVAQAKDFADELKILLDNVNDILGDASFRNNIKQLAVNANDLVLQTGQLMESGKTAMAQVEGLTHTLRERVDKITGDVASITGRADSIMGKAEGLIENISARVDEVGSLTGDKEFLGSIRRTVANISEVSAAMAAKRVETEQMLDNINRITADLTSISSRVRTITEQVDPSTIAGAISSISTAVTSLTDVVNKIKQEPVLALSINKAADRIIKMKFDEMAKQPQFGSADATMREISRWVREGMNRGYFTDPAWEYSERPYVMDR